jgi:hypothetical protein
MSQDTLVFIIPAASNGRIEIINAVTEERASVATAAGQPVNVYYHKADAPPPPPPPPPPQPPQPGVGNYGDGWPTPPTSANYIWLRQGGNNNINFKQSTVIEGETFDGNNSNYALKLTDCKGTVYFKGCTFKNAKQGIAVSNPSKLSHAPSVHLIGCQFVDCYKHETPGASQPMAQVGVYYHDPMPRDDDQPTIGMYGCRFINSGIGSSDARLREQFARQFHHGAYIKGNAIIEAYDNLFVNYSGQGIKAIGMAADLRRNAFLGGAVGFNFGQDAGQQDKTGRWQMACYASGNLVYGMGDLQADNQRLGWGCVLESCHAMHSRQHLLLAYLSRRQDAGNPRQPRPRLPRERLHGRRTKLRRGPHAPVRSAGQRRRMGANRSQLGAVRHPRQPRLTVRIAQRRHDLRRRYGLRLCPAQPRDPRPRAHRTAGPRPHHHRRRRARNGTGADCLTDRVSGFSLHAERRGAGLKENPRSL